MGVLSPLLVWDRLEVGPVQVEKKRIIAPYRIYAQGTETQNELIYTYEEAVFDPADPQAHNLAAMITAQLAFNYGLFCRQMVFHGLFDTLDKRFIRQMVENTSREIYVNKILWKENPFLKPGLKAAVAPRKLRRYTQAEISFVSSSQLPPPGWQHWQTDKHRHCVLSSGGKDSLLGYGLLKEVGAEVHPIFVNESGRHWFTAVNAFKYLKSQDPHTARVWTNSDRIFSWALRQMPFIRPNFADIRSDDYPIRLWTVAVFLFGVLPLMRKRKIGRLLIGNEYDTTRREQFEGIPHYDGLYDQSRFFDEALSAYFLKKGWSISQFSILRPLSELLILKILVGRYPDLQRQQLSCHAAHKDPADGRIHPCGRCEKCRRITGMLMALGADPQACGYSEAQVEECLQALARKGVKQLGTDATHLLYLLAEKGLIQLPAAEQAVLAPHAEVKSLRFDPLRARPWDIPIELRRPLLEIFQQYAREVLYRKKGKWKPYSWQKSADFLTPYPFEPHPHALPAGSPSFLWGELTWPEAEARLKNTDTALLPVGAIEQHGPHLPMDIDAFDAEYLAKCVAAACTAPRPLVLPLIPYGVSYHHDDFPGTLSVRNESLSQFVYDIGLSLARNGIKKLIIINGHGDNKPTLNYAAQMINRDTGIFTCVDTGESSDIDIEKLCSTPNDVHAGEIETSTALATRPQLVRMDLARPMTPSFSVPYLNFSSQRGLPWYVHTRRISENGVLGDPTQASAEKGKLIWDIMVAHLVNFVEMIKSLSLEEIYQKNY
ncbi:MAG: creatininase family protein [Bacteroidetes bacterium]|nr:MAG: creatininase family protein [Bacteroidota bacterium]